MLRHWRDLQSVLWLLVLPALILWQWQQPQWQLLPFALTLLLAVGLCCINHNHAHRPLWRQRWLNRLTDLWIGVLQGHPVFMFEVAHINSHHRYNQSEQDVTRVGDAGHAPHALAWLLFPLRVLLPLRGLRQRWLQQMSRWRRVGVMLHYVPLLCLWLAALLADWQRALLYVGVPQLVSLHFLLASNYLQHAATEHGSAHNHARNFTGRLFNLLLFNVGYHSAHHAWPGLHWTALPAAHQRLLPDLQPALQRRSFLVFIGHDLLLLPVLNLAARLSFKIKH